MKNLFAALICTFIGVNAFATELTPTKDIKNPSKTEINTKEITKISGDQTVPVTFNLSCGKVTVAIYAYAVNAPGVLDNLQHQLENSYCKKKKWLIQKPQITTDIN